MKADYNARITRQLADIYEAVRGLPESQRNKIINKAQALAVTSRRVLRSKYAGAPAPGDTHDQIADRYIAKQAIFDALCQGRRITFLDSREFGCSEMHTQITCIRQDIAKRDLPWTLCDRWVEFKEGKRCKEYWLEEKTIN